MDEAELARQMEKAEAENAEIAGTIRGGGWHLLLADCTNFYFCLAGDDDESEMEAGGENEADDSDGEEDAQENKGDDEE